MWHRGYACEQGVHAQRELVRRALHPAARRYGPVHVHLHLSRSRRGRGRRWSNRPRAPSARRSCAPGARRPSRSTQPRANACARTTITAPPVTSGSTTTRVWRMRRTAAWRAPASISRSSRRQGRLSCRRPGLPAPMQRARAQGGRGGRVHRRARGPGQGGRRGQMHVRHVLARLRRVRHRCRLHGDARLHCEARAATNRRASTTRCAARSSCATTARTRWACCCAGQLRGERDVAMLR